MWYRGRFLVPGINGKNGAMEFSLIINRAHVGQAAHGSLAIQHLIVKSRVEKRINCLNTALRYDRKLKIR
jgi:hypothetical protein